MEKALSGALDQQRDGDVAGRDDRVIGGARRAEAVELRLDNTARRRRIGDERHCAAPGAEAGKCVESGGERGGAVVNDAPDIAKDDVITPGEFGEACDQSRQKGPSLLSCAAVPPQAEPAPC